MTLQDIKDKYIGKKLELYLIDGEEVVLAEDGGLTFRFKRNCSTTRHWTLPTTCAPLL